MVLSRKLDDKEIQLKNQSLIFFQISGAGHEAILDRRRHVPPAPATTGSIRYYRDRALCLALGMTPLEMLLSAVGAKDDPSSGGRQMPSHWGHTALNIVSQSSPTGTQCLQAVGCAEAGRLYEKHHGHRRPSTIAHHADEVTYLSLGDGTTSEGEFWESLNSACLAPACRSSIIVEDNGYAISVPGRSADARRRHLEAGVAVPRPAGPERRRHRLPGELRRRCSEAVAYARARKGPAFVHAKVIRPYSHSLSDDEQLYKTPEERAAEAKRDPIARLADLPEV